MSGAAASRRQEAGLLAASPPHIARLKAICEGRRVGALLGRRHWPDSYAARPRQCP
jgi:hypothetical protein